MTSQRGVRAYLLDIQTEADRAIGFRGDRDFDAFAADERTVYATLYCLTIIGEATKQIPPALRSRFPDVPWHLIAGMRDWLVHGYFGIQVPIVWETLKQDVPALRAAVEGILADLDREAPP